MALPPLTLNAWLRYDVIQRLLPRVRPLETVLELGAGMGAVGTRLAQRARYTGVEPDPQSAAVLRERVEQTGRGRVFADLADVPADDRFDLACAFEVLEHIPDDAGALREWRSRLVPGGHLMLSVPAYQARYAAADEMVGHCRRYDPDQLTGLLVETGFEVLDARAYGGPFGYLLETARNTAARRVLARTERDALISTTGGGSRVFQPPQSLGVVTAAASYPFRVLQRPMTRRGVGLVALARRGSE
jgi:SAM-dependent methyltransferase